MRNENRKHAFSVYAKIEKQVETVNAKDQSKG